MRRASAASVICLSTLAARVAHASDSVTCDSSKRPRVDVRLAPDSPTKLPGFVGLLRAELAPRGIDVCDPAPGHPAIATIDVTAKPGAVALTVEIWDALTAKRVSRDVSLDGVPGDSQPLMVALAADELLRASWAELAFRTAPAPRQPVPAAIDATVRDSLGPPSPPRGRVGLGVVAKVEHYASGITLYGADVGLRAALFPRFAVGASVGLRTGPDATGTDGEVRPTAIVASARVAVTMTPTDRAWGLDGVAALEYQHLFFAPTPHAGASGNARTGDTAVAELGLEGGVWVLPRLRVVADAMAALPVRPVYITDARREVAGVGGVGVVAGLGAWSTF